MKRGTEEFEKWKNMYRILFPEDTRIPSPCRCSMRLHAPILRPR